MIKKVICTQIFVSAVQCAFNYVIFLISLIVLAMVSVILGVKPTFYLLQAPIALILILIMSYGCGMILATIGVFFQRYGISLVCSTYAGYVYMCDFLLS